MAKILLQVPEGLKRRALEIAEELEARGDEVIISSGPCWGACDVRPSDASALGCDRIVHVGHTRFLKTDFPVEYVEWRAAADPLPALVRDAGKLADYPRIGLLTSLQFVDALPNVKQFLEGRGHTVRIGEAGEGERHLYPGQLLGCDVRAASAVVGDVDAFLYVGSGKFHPLGALLKTDRPVFGLDIERGDICHLDDSLFVKQRAVAIANAKGAKVWGILISTKPGQNAVEAARAYKQRIEAAGRKAFLISGDEIRPEQLAGMEVDAWLNTACPRIAVENRGDFNWPMLNPDELEEALK